MESVKSSSAAPCWRSPPAGWLKFNICGVELEDKAGCGGVLRDMEGWLEQYSLVLRPSSLHSVFAETETAMLTVGNVVFSLADRNGNCMAFSLAMAVVNRMQMFKAWW
ncbi:hypothetical protein J1N35_028097 [Gossypium stocksii]|uniref:Uncharacterized protein n=1 Tax=Gossypium stocksii TaxID=47602 RepID=A0A9D3UVQ8_9ROSI|nr:hypothetical protein J1N35_028097 [Gossypium stocksii]